MNNKEVLVTKQIIAKIQMELADMEVRKVELEDSLVAHRNELEELTRRA